MLLSRRNQMLLEFSFWNEPQPRAGPNIYELRTYKLKVPASRPLPLPAPFPCYSAAIGCPKVGWVPRFPCCSAAVGRPEVGWVPPHVGWGFWPVPLSGPRTEVCVCSCASQGPCLRPSDPWRLDSFRSPPSGDAGIQGESSFHSLPFSLSQEP